MNKYIAALLVTLLVHAASMAIERRLGRSRSAFRRPVGSLALVALLVSTMGLVVFLIPAQSPYFAAACILAAGCSLLIVQVKFGLPRNAPTPKE